MDTSRQTDEIAAANNTARLLISIVTPMLDGEILFRDGKVDAGLSHLRAAVKAKDEFRYGEPPGWLIPGRHSLRASLMEAWRCAGAVRVYRDDLTRLPEDGSAPFVLVQSLHEQSKDEQAMEADARNQKIWGDGGIKITSSCLWQPGRRR